MLSLEDTERLRCEQNRYEQTRNFLDILLRKSEETIKMFFEMVRTGTDAQLHIYQKLFQHEEQQDGTSHQEDCTSEQQARCLVKRNYVYLLHHLKVSNYFDALYGAGVLSFGDRESLRYEQNRYEQTRNFLNTILQKSNRRIKMFLEIVKWTDAQPHIYQQLLQNVEQQDGTSQQEDSSSEQPARDVIAKNYEYLCCTLRVSNYLDALYEAEVLSSDEMESLRYERRKSKQTRSFLDILLMKSDKMIKVFFEILKRMTDAQPHIYQQLFQHAKQQNGTSQQEDSSSEQPAINVVRKNYVYLLHELRVSNYLDALYKAELLSLLEMESLWYERNKYEQTRNFLDILITKSERKVKEFLEIVRIATDLPPHISQQLFPCTGQQDEATQQGACVQEFLLTEKLAVQTRKDER